MIKNFATLSRCYVINTCIHVRYLWVRVCVHIIHAKENGSQRPPFWCQFRLPGFERWRPYLGENDCHLICWGKKLGKEIRNQSEIIEQRKVFGTSGNWRGVPTSFSSPVWFLKAPLPYCVWVPYFLLTGWLVAGCSWPANLTGWLLAGWLVGGLAGWLGLAGLLTSLAGRLLAGWLYILYGWLVFDGCGLPDLWAWIWPRSDLVLTSFWTSYWTSYNLHLLIGYINDEEDKVPTSY